MIAIDELKTFLECPNFARFIRTNLHIHTPATSWDWDAFEGQTTRSSTITPETFFKELNKTELDLVAITDHNCVLWCEQLIALAQKARTEKKSKLHILPGVEITTYEGPHLIAIFSENQNISEINKMLIRLGLAGLGDKGDRVGLKTSGKNPEITEVFKEIEGLNGLVIAPHIQSEDGIWGNKAFKGRPEILNHPSLRVLAAPSGDIKKVVEGQGKIRLLYKNMDTDQYTNSYSFINIADCHRIEDFETNNTWICMTKPELDGIRQIIYEPELRVAHKITKGDGNFEHNDMLFFEEQPDEDNHAHLLGIATTGGMLDGQNIAFSPHQNCIIGKNYAGKSAILDCLRFVLDVIPEDKYAHSKFAERIKTFIGEGGEARVYLITKDRKVYGITRLCTCTRSRDKGQDIWQIEGKPDVYLLWKEEFKRESDLAVSKIFQLEVFPQGEINKIKDDVNKQIRIIDALAETQDYLQDLTLEETDETLTSLGKLVENRRQLVSQTQKQEQLTEEIKDISQLEQEIDKLEELSTSPLLKEKKEWTVTKLNIDRRINIVKKLESAWANDELTANLSIDDTKQEENVENKAIGDGDIFNKDTATATDYSNHASEIFRAVAESTKTNTSNIKQELESAGTTLKGLENQRKEREEKIDADIRKNLKAGAEDTQGEALIERITEKRRNLAALQQKQQELDNIKSHLERDNKTREELLKTYRQKWGEVRQKRKDIVSLIETQSASNIKAELIENNDKDRYRKLLGSIADGLTSTTNRIQNKENQLDRIVATIAPEQLINTIKAGDAKKFTDQVPEITENTARILMSMGQADQLRLEECTLDDTFKISYKKIGDTIFTPIDSGLSGGEQALALISVAMVPKPQPLLIDQPEDELGPALITQELVEQIRAVKSTRQLIFVTHVPNIPVLADSEQIIYIEQEINGTTKASKVQCCGSLDEEKIVSHLLELDGGDMAFKKRLERYSKIINA